jgi:hypothetical protein
LIGLVGKRHESETEIETIKDGRRGSLEEVAHLMGEALPRGEDDGGSVGPGRSVLDARIGQKKDVDVNTNATEDREVLEEVCRGILQNIAGTLQFFRVEDAEAGG